MKCYQQICLILAFVLMQDAAVSGHDFCTYNNIEYLIDDALYYPDNCVQYVCSYHHRAGVAMDLLPMSYCYCPDFSSREKREAIELKVNTAHGLYREDSDEVQQLIKRSKRSTDSQMCRFNNRFYAINETIHHNVHHCLILTCVDNGQSALIEYSVMEDCVCETRGACESNPCFNGTCVSEDYETYRCACHPGFTGEYCQTDFDECGSSPCINGNCSDGINDYSCTCEDGYTGVMCETEIDECDSDPCENGATCEDEVNGFSCLCVDGYNGTTCDNDIDECQSAPCLNTGNCTDEVNGVTCDCHSHFTGEFCQEYDYTWNGKRYVFETEVKNLTAANQTCQDMNGNLPVFTVEHWDALVKPAEFFFSNKPIGFHAGLEINSDGITVDVFGNPIDVVLSLRNGNCIGFYELTFHADKCDGVYKYFCEL